MNLSIWILCFFTWFILLFSVEPKIKRIAADVAVIRATVAQQAKECHNLDTVESNK